MNVGLIFANLYTIYVIMYVHIFKYVYILHCAEEGGGVCVACSMGKVQKWANYPADVY